MVNQDKRQADLLERIAVALEYFMEHHKAMQMTAPVSAGGLNAPLGPALSAADAPADDGGDNG